MTSTPSLPDSVLEQFGIRPEDELLHPVAPDELHWNESVFFDWFRDEKLAGHIRIGRMPNQGRAWLWVFLFQEGDWVVIEEPRLPIEALSGGGFDYDGRGLRFRREVLSPLRENRISVEGLGRVVTGPRRGRLLPVAVDLFHTSVGPAHSVGEQSIEGHSAAFYSANRYEQPCKVRGHQKVGDSAVGFEGWGERDHSWGPRRWNMEWRFLVVHSDVQSLQGVRVNFDPDAFADVGYLGRNPTQHFVECELDLDYRDEDVVDPYSGRIRFVAEDGTVVSGHLLSISAAEIDASHAFDPPQPSLYRRALVRFTPDGGGAPMLGWLEINRFPHGMILDEPG